MKKQKRELVNEVGGRWTMEHFIAFRERHLLGEIIAHARSLVDDLTLLREGLRKHGISYSFNSLGAIQGRGSSLDRMLGELGLIKDLKRDFGEEVTS